MIQRLCLVLGICALLLSAAAAQDDLIILPETLSYTALTGGELSVTVTSELFTDTDSNGVASLGDFVRLRFEIENIGVDRTPPLTLQTWFDPRTPFFRPTTQQNFENAPLLSFGPGESTTYLLVLGLRDLETAQRNGDTLSFADINLRIFETGTANLGVSYGGPRRYTLRLSSPALEMTLSEPTLLPNGDADGNSTITAGDIVDMTVELRNTGALDYAGPLRATVGFDNAAISVVPDSSTSVGGAALGNTAIFDGVAVDETLSYSFRVQIPTDFRQPSVTVRVALIPDTPARSPLLAEASEEIDLNTARLDVESVTGDFAPDGDLDGNGVYTPGDRLSVVATIRNNGPVAARPDVNSIQIRTTSGLDLDSVVSEALGPAPALATTPSFSIYTAPITRTIEPDTTFEMTFDIILPSPAEHSLFRTDTLIDPLGPDGGRTGLGVFVIASAENEAISFRAEAGLAPGGDLDGDGGPSAGDTLLYTFTISNNSDVPYFENLVFTSLPNYGPANYTDSRFYEEIASTALGDTRWVTLPDESERRFEGTDRRFWGAEVYAGYDFVPANGEISFQFTTTIDEAAVPGDVYRRDNRLYFDAEWLEVVSSPPERINTPLIGSGTTVAIGGLEPDDAEVALAWALVDDLDGNGFVDAGDTVEVTASVTNTTVTTPLVLVGNTGWDEAAGYRITTVEGRDVFGSFLTETYSYRLNSGGANLTYYLSSLQGGETRTLTYRLTVNELLPTGFGFISSRFALGLSADSTLTASEVLIPLGAFSFSPSDDPATASTRPLDGTWTQQISPDFTGTPECVAGAAPIAGFVARPQTLNITWSNPISFNDIQPDASGTDDSPTQVTLTEVDPEGMIVTATYTQVDAHTFEGTVTFDRRSAGPPSGGCVLETTLTLTFNG